MTRAAIEAWFVEQLELVMAAEADARAWLWHCLVAEARRRIERLQGATT